MKPSDPLLLADVTLRCEMYPAGKVDISWHLAIPGFPQSDHLVRKPIAKILLYREGGGILYGVIK